jgi:hypothetical protein
VREGKHQILYVRMLMALYGMLIASILWYKKFRKDIESIGFEVNPYDICVANRTTRGMQHTVPRHADDVKSSHVDSEVNDDFEAYLTMILDYNTSGPMQVDMRYYIDGMVQDFPYPIKAIKTAPWTDKLIKVDITSKFLDIEKKAMLHIFSMKAMFICKRGRPDVSPGVGFLTGRVKEPRQQDWMKLLKVLGFLKGTRDDVLTLEADDCQTLTWYVDAAFAVHVDMRSQTGAIFTLGKGAIISDALKQKINSRSSTEAELISIDDEVSKILWSKRFKEWQEFLVLMTIMCQDNTSTMTLGNKGNASSGKRTTHFDIKMFYVTDLIARDEVTVMYCHTDDMIGDCMTKPLTGAKFHKFRALIMNLSGKHHRAGQQECVRLEVNQSSRE